MHNQDVFVGLVAVGLGTAALCGAVYTNRLVKVSQLAASIDQKAGRVVLAIASASLGLFLIGVGLSLLL